MSDEPLITLSQEFDTALRDLSSARAAYEDEPRNPEKIAALGAARKRLDDARSTMDEERRRLGLGEPWRLAPAATKGVQPPPVWSITYSPG